MIASCDPALILEVDNRTDQTLTIYVDGARTFSVKPGEILKHRTIEAASGYYTIEAKNNEGRIYYSKKFAWDELREADYKITVLPQNE